MDSNRYNSLDSGDKGEILTAIFQDNMDLLNSSVSVASNDDRGDEYDYAQDIIDSSYVTFGDLADGIQKEISSGDYDHAIRTTETTESEAKSPQECPHCGAFYGRTDDFKDHVEQHEREGTNDNSEKDRQNQDYPEGWKGESIANERSDHDNKYDHDADSDFKYHDWNKNENYNPNDDFDDNIVCNICGAELSYEEYAERKLAGESKAKEDFGQFTIQNPDLDTDKYPMDQEGFGRASWEDAEIEHRKRWLIKNGFDSNAEDNAYLPYYSLPSMVRAVLAKDLHVGGIQAMGESGLVEPDEGWDAVQIIADPLEAPTYDKERKKNYSLDTPEEIDDYIKNGKEDEDKDEAEERSKKSRIDTMMDLGAGDLEGMIPDGVSVQDYLEDVVSDDDPDEKDEAGEFIGAMGELEELKDTYGSSPNADPTTTPLEDHSGTDDSSDTQLDTVDAQQDTSDVTEDTVEESFGDCGCKNTKKAKMSWESARDSDKQYWLRDMGEDEGYSYYYFEHLPKRVGESLVDKFKIEESEDRGWSKIPALERTNLLRKIGFPPRDAELVANLEYPQLSESLKKDVNDAVIGKKKAEESQREKPDEQLAFENDLYSNMYDGFLKRRGERVDSKKN